MSRSLCIHGYKGRTCHLPDRSHIRVCEVRCNACRATRRFLPPLGPHALRRACATEMIRRDANPWHVKELLGHEDFRSLDAYVKLAILDLKAAHRRCHPRERGEDPPSEAPPIPPPMLR